MNTTLSQEGAHLNKCVQLLLHRVQSWLEHITYHATLTGSCEYPPRGWFRVCGHGSLERGCATLRTQKGFITAIREVQVDSRNRKCTTSRLHAGQAQSAVQGHPHVD